MLVIADLSPYWAWPPTGGGPLRVYNLNRAVAERVRVLQFSARPTIGHRQRSWRSWIGSRVCQLADEYTEYQYFHPLLLGSSYLLYRLGLHSDIFLSQGLTWLAPRQLSHVVRDAAIVQVEHPWLFDLAQRLAEGRPIVYVAHNVEAKLWGQQSVGKRRFLRRLAGQTEKLEARAVQMADVTVAMSSEDATYLSERYGVAPQKIEIIPNGVDSRLRQPASPLEREAARKRLGIGCSTSVVLFTGSDHYPNKEALQHMIKWQAALSERDILFLVVGSVGRGVASTQHLRVEGFVDDLRDYLAAADIALTPLASGSGTSLKIVEYLACGLPTITTAVGMRGLSLDPGRDILLAELSEFPRQIVQLLEDGELRARLRVNGRAAVEQQYSWHQLSQSMFRIYERLTSCTYAL